MSQKTVSSRLVTKIMVTFLLLLLVAGVGYVFITYYFTQKWVEESTQRLNAGVAQHLIDHHFVEEKPYLPDGTVNKPLFGEVMDDMMAVNQGIEVYLLSETGMVLYSVVLDHSDNEKPLTQIDLEPIRTFMEGEGQEFVLGDDPRNPDRKKIFSAASFDVEGQKGFIYIILSSLRSEEVNTSLAGSFFLRMGLGASLATILFAGLIGILAIWYLTQNLREIIEVVRRFQQGDMTARIENSEHKDLSVLTDTFNHMADTLVANLEELKSIESLRRELIANVSHDLRTPLAITRGYVETLQIKKDTLTPEEHDKYLQVIRNSVEKLSGLIQQLFEYSKLEAKQIEPQKEPFAIADLAHDVAANYQQMAEEKHIRLQLSIEEGLPLVFADISLVERVIQNLMDNALKFTPEGGRVTLEMKADEHQVYVAIQDTGQGIPSTDLPHIFERFKKASATQKSAMDGVGLGLAIAKKIMEIHNSTISVRSQPNVGTTFQFYLPSVSPG
ncbi:MAG TPA: sensor histidine kinase [Cytophagales bacterium]|nr:sensor histidine kinase [Cytophagales bacterium]HAA17806.1 sensor histidine kinase [Cytophagales bacterium]HAP58841.1 sensor histidine kinase [Cytophagales bacterium]